MMKVNWLRVSTKLLDEAQEQTSSNHPTLPAFDSLPTELRMVRLTTQGVLLSLAKAILHGVGYEGDKDTRAVGADDASVGNREVVDLQRARQLRDE